MWEFPAMLVIYAWMLIFVTPLLLTPVKVYAQEEAAAPAEAPAEPKEEAKESYRFDADSFIINRRPDITYRVSKVISADTILLENGERVRLLGVRVFEGDAERSYRMVRRLLEGKEVRLEFGRRNRDIHGSLLATVYKGDLNVNALLMEEFSQHTEIDPALSFSPEFLDSVFPDRKTPMSLWELTLGEGRPAEKKIAVVEVKDRPVIQGELVKEAKDYIVIRRAYKGLELIRKKDIEKLTFK